MEHMYNIDTICTAIRQDWQTLRPTLCTRIEDLYRMLGIDSTLDPNDQHYYLSALYSITRMIRPRNVLQTGTYVGCSTVAVALAMRDYGIEGTLDTIDPEPNCYGHLKNIDPVRLARNVVESSGLAQYVRFHRGYSVMAWDKDRININDAPEGLLYNFVQNRETDLLIVDGDHTLNGTFWDIEVGVRTLRPGGAGLIFVHDYKAIPSVRQAVKHWKSLYTNSIIFRGCAERNGFALIQYTKVVPYNEFTSIPQELGIQA